LPPPDYGLKRCGAGFLWRVLTRGTGSLANAAIVPVKSGDGIADLQIKFRKPGAISGRVAD